MPQVYETNGLGVTAIGVMCVREGVVGEILISEGL